MSERMTFTAKTVEQAIADAAATFGVAQDALQYEIVKEAKKGFFGFGASDAEIAAWIVEKKPAKKEKKEKKEQKAEVAAVTAKEEAPIDATAFAPALELLTTVLADFGIAGEVKLTADEDESGAVIGEIVGEGVELLIGHHGETLDALQYLCNLRLRHEDEEGAKLKLDIANYRAKRQATLCKLAERKAEQVLKYGKAVALEPMNPYERRIIHASVQSIAGVTTISTGTQNNRRVVIYPEGGSPEVAPVRTGNRRRR